MSKMKKIILNLICIINYSHKTEIMDLMQNNARLTRPAAQFVQKQKLSYHSYTHMHLSLKTSNNSLAVFEWVSKTFDSFKILTVKGYSLAFELGTKTNVKDF